jgi:site-specific DNA-methyltransferase (adenine-specific)
LNRVEPNNIYNMDCLEGMKLMADASVDMILCDLPYGTTACAWDSVIPLEPLWEQYRRIIKLNGAIVLTASQPFTTKLIASNMEMFKYCWVWVKSRSTDFVNAKNKPMRRHEDICVFSNGTTANGSLRRMPYFPQGLVYKPSHQYRPTPKMKNGGVVGERPSHVRGYDREWENYPTSVIEIPNPNNDTWHPTQKPIPLFEYLIRTYTNPGELVLDNCMGSGTTAIAAMNADRQYIGFELDPDYYTKATERINKHSGTNGQTIITPAPFMPLQEASLLHLFQ